MVVNIFLSSFCFVHFFSIIFFIRYYCSSMDTWHDIPPCHEIFCAMCQQNILRKFNHVHLLTLTCSPNSNPQNFGHFFGTSISSLPHYFNINADHLTSSSKVGSLGDRPNLCFPQSRHSPKTHPLLCHLESWHYVQITKV